MAGQSQTGGTDRGTLPPGVRLLDALDPGEGAAYGPETAALIRLREAGVPVAPTWLVRLGDAPETRLAAAVEGALERGEVARIRPAVPSEQPADESERTPWWVNEDLASADEARSAAREVLAALRGAFGSVPSGAAVRVVACSAQPSGHALSADTARGDPDELSVWARPEDASCWRIDRRSLRIVQRGGGVDADDASAAADLADRAQLALGRPVWIEWCRSDERRLVLAGLRFARLPSTVGVGAFRRVALVAEDEGTIAPLAVDALDRALGGDGASRQAVRRVFARPYRRMDAGVPRFRRTTAAASVGKAGARAARVMTDVAVPLTAARRSHGQMQAQLALVDAVPLASLEDHELVETIRERHALVAEAFARLDRGREATGAVLTALEATVGPLERDAIGVLAAPRPTRWRRFLEERLRRLGQDIHAVHGGLHAGVALTGERGRRFRQLRSELADVRPLGIDVRPDAMGASDRVLRGAVEGALGREPFPSDRERRRIARDIRQRVRGRFLGRVREGVAASLLVLIDRVGRAKGAVADDLAASLLRLRRAALVAGERLVERGVLEEAEHAFELHMVEIEQALADEPGAYAARARLRREDDDRWARFEAPRRLEGRRI